MSAQCEAIFTMRCDEGVDPSDCDKCMEFVTTCDVCHEPGHTDSMGWYGENLGTDKAMVYCGECVPSHLLETEA